MLDVRHTNSTWLISIYAYAYLHLFLISDVGGIHAKGDMRGLLPPHSRLM